MDKNVPTAKCALRNLVIDCPTGVAHGDLVKVVAAGFAVVHYAHNERVTAANLEQLTSLRVNSRDACFAFERSCVLVDDESGQPVALNDVVEAVEAEYIVGPPLNAGDFSVVLDVEAESAARPIIFVETPAARGELTCGLVDGQGGGR